MTITELNSNSMTTTETETKRGVTKQLLINIHRYLSRRIDGFLRGQHLLIELLKNLKDVEGSRFLFIKPSFI